MYKIGDKFQSRNGQIGTIVNLNGVPMLQVRNSLNKITQMIVINKIDLSMFKKVEV